MGFILQAFYFLAQSLDRLVSIRKLNLQRHYTDLTLLLLLLVSCLISSLVAHRASYEPAHKTSCYCVFSAQLDSILLNLCHSESCPGLSRSEIPQNVSLVFVTTKCSKSFDFDYLGSFSLSRDDIGNSS